MYVDWLYDMHDLIWWGKKWIDFDWVKKIAIVPTLVKATLWLRLISKNECLCALPFPYENDSKCYCHLFCLFPKLETQKHDFVYIWLLVVLISIMYEFDHSNLLLL